MRKQLLLLAMLCLALFSSAQPSIVIDDKFEKPNKNKMAVYETLTPLSEEVYVYKDGKRRVSEIWHLSEKGKEVTTLQVPRDFQYITGSEIYGKTLGVYKKIDAKKGTTSIYFNMVDKKPGVAQWNPYLIREVPAEEVSVGFAVSPDHELFGLNLVLKDKNENTIGWEMLTTTAKGFIFWNTQIENKFKGDSYNVQNFSVDDEGQITLLTISYSSSRKFAEDVELNLTIGDEYGVKTYSTPVPKREIWQAKMLKLKDGRIFIAGYYTNERKGMEAGLATTFFNVDKKLFTKVRFTDFKATKDAAKAKAKKKKKSSSVKGVSKVKKSKKAKAKAKEKAKVAKQQAAAAKKKAKSQAKENIKEPKPEDYRYIMLDMFERPNGSIAIFGEQRAIEKEKTKNGEITNLFAKDIIYNSVTAKGAVSEYVINKNQVGIGGPGETNHRLGGVSFFVGQAGQDICVIYNDLKSNEPGEEPEEIYQQQGFVDGNMVVCTINEKNKMTYRRIDGADDDEAPYNIIQFKNGVVYAIRKNRASYVLTRLPL